MHEHRIVAPAPHILLCLIKGIIARKAAVEVILDGVIYRGQIVKVLNADWSCIIADDNSVLTPVPAIAQVKPFSCCLYDMTS